MPDIVNPATVDRMRDAILTVAAITSVSIGTHGVSASVIVGPASRQATAQPVIDAFDWSQAAQDAYDNVRARTRATNLTSNPISEMKAQRAFALVSLDEVNVLRAWLASFKTEVAAAATLADLKIRVATLPATPARTPAQLKTAVNNKIAAGEADT